MNSHAVSDLAARSIYVSYWLLFGLYLLFKRRYYLSVRDAVRHSSLCSASEHDEALRAAIERRAQAEGAPRPVGGWAGAICFVLGVFALFEASPALLYGILCFSLTTLTAAVYLRLKNTQPLRTAVLSPRSFASTIPLYWFVIAAVLALSSLVYVTIPQETVPAVLVCCSALASTFFAWRLAQLPAIFTGVDIGAEQRVDEKLRFARSAVPMMFALVQTFVFSTQVHYDLSTLQLVVWVLNVPGWIAFFIWMRIPDKPAATAAAQ